MSCPAFDEWQGQNKMFCKAANYATWAHPPFLFPPSIHSMCLQCQSPRKQPYTCDSSHRYNLRTRLSTPSPCASQYSPPAPRATYPTSKRIRFASISSTSSLSSVFATPPSSPSAPTLLAESYPLECEIKTTNDQIANLVEFLTNEVATSRKERDEIALEAERLKELAARYSSEATRLQKLRDTISDSRFHLTWEESITCGMCKDPCTRPYLIQECKHMFCLECLQQWFNECLHKDLEDVRLPAHLEPRRNLPYTAQTLEEFYIVGVTYVGLSYTCLFCRCRVWEKPQEERTLTAVISSLTAALGPAVQADVNDDVNSDVWAGIFLRAIED
ncbi:hypothetical protein EDD16DRAFT_1524586 [Pisolithus croceorrhizus]|nr:hypothetical protein EDD16DRAFT_1524586 [Pisolithus croceorrhizus]